MKCICILTDGFEELEAVGTLALLRRSGIQIDVAALDNNQATGRFELTMGNLMKLDDIDVQSYDLLFLPGGPHYAKLEQNQRVVQIIKNFAQADKWIAAICAAPTILGRLGLLEGKNYTCFTSMNEDFKGNYIDDYVAVDGKIITGRSAAAVIDFSFAIIEAILGKEAAEKTKQSIYYYH